MSELQKATDALIAAVAEAGEATLRADAARAGGTITFDIAAQHRKAEQNMHDKADEMLSEYVKARKSGSITLRSQDASPQGT